jgi:hypothetical protein
VVEFHFGCDGQEAYEVAIKFMQEENHYQVSIWFQVHWSEARLKFVKWAYCITVVMCNDYSKMNSKLYCALF